MTNPATPLGGGRGQAAISSDVAAFGTYALPPAMEKLRRLSQRLGRGPVARRACSLIRRVVSAGRAGPFDVEAFPGQRARLYPSENLSDKRVFAGVQFWDSVERAALGRAVRDADEPVYFVDAGANAGLYTLAVRAEAREKPLRIIAIEPDPENLERLRFNLSASGVGDGVQVFAAALSDAEGETHIASSHANRGELTIGETGTRVAMRPLLDIVREAGFPRVDALKIDIEGMELPVLTHFIEHADPALWPAVIILEAQRDEVTPALSYMNGVGYEVSERTRMNVVLHRTATAGKGNGHG